MGSFLLGVKLIKIEKEKGIRKKEIIISSSYDCGSTSHDLLILQALFNSISLQKLFAN